MGNFKHSEEKIFYVYIYVDPRNNSPFYVGKGYNRRYLDHLNTAKNKKSNNYKVNKIRKIIRETRQDPEIILFKTGLSEDEAFSIEIELIKRWGRKDNKTGCLLNLTDGGEGSKGMIPWNKDLKGCHSEETLKVLSEKASRIKSEEERRKISIGNKGKKRTEEQKRHQSEVTKGREGRKKTEEEKKKIACSMVGVNTWMKDKEVPKEIRKKQANSIRITWAIRRGLLL